MAASANPPMAGCPPATVDPAAIALTDWMTVDYCAGPTPVEDAVAWVLLLNGVGLAMFLGGVTLVSLERLMALRAGLVE